MTLIQKKNKQMKLINLIGIVIVGFVLCFASCKKDEGPDLFDSMDDLAFDKTLTKFPLSQVRALHTGTDVTMAKGKISGIVISEVDQRNVPAPANHVVIQDGLSGIVLDFGESNTRTWPLYRGDSIVVIVTDAQLTRRNGALILTGLDRTRMQLIGYNANNTGVNNRVKVREVSIAELQNNFASYESTQIILRAEINPVPTGNDTYGGDKVLTDASGTGVVLHTNADALFAAQPAAPAAPYVVPSAGYFSGIAVAGGAAKQLWLRNLGDVRPYSVIYPNFPDNLENFAATAASPKPNYLPAGNVGLKAGTYTFNNASVQKDAADKKNGNWAVRFADNNTAPAHFQMNFNSANGASKVTFSYAIYGTDPGSALRLEYSTDNGTTWLQTGADITVSNQALQTATFRMDIRVPVRFRVTKLGVGAVNNGRLNIDDFTVYQN
jgi:hypothetical protein